MDGRKLELDKCKVLESPIKIGEFVPQTLFRKQVGYLGAVLLIISMSICNASPARTLDRVLLI